ADERDVGDTCCDHSRLDLGEIQRAEEREIAERREKQRAVAQPIDDECALGTRRRGRTLAVVRERDVRRGAKEAEGSGEEREVARGGDEDERRGPEQDRELIGTG